MDLTAKVPVLNKGFVQLQEVMGNDLAIINAARTSYLGDSKGEEQDRKLLHYLYTHEHHTPFEMVEFKFRVKAPLMVMQQWYRHRTWSFNSQSGRYTPFDADDFYIPEWWRKQSDYNKQGSEGFLSHEANDLQDAAYRSTLRRAKANYEAALAEGVSKEMARLFLPGFAMYYTVVAKTDARNLIHFLRLRLNNHAQSEIRQYAQVIYQNFFKPILPWTAEILEEHDPVFSYASKK